MATKCRSSSEFHDTRRFNRGFNTEASIDDIINTSSDSTNELVISNGNNCKIMENNVAESDINTTEIIVDDTNKINVNVSGEHFFKKLQLTALNENICFGQHLNNLRRQKYRPPHSRAYEYQLHLL